MAMVLSDRFGLDFNHVCQTTSCPKQSFAYQPQLYFANSIFGKPQLNALAKNFNVIFRAECPRIYSSMCAKTVDLDWVWNSRGHISGFNEGWPMALLFNSSLVADINSRFTPLLMKIICGNNQCQIESICDAQLKKYF